MNQAKDGMTGRARVAVTGAADYQERTLLEAVRRQFSLIDPEGKAVARGDRVLIKPNFIAPKPRANAVQTDPAVILAIAQVVKDMGGLPFLADSPAWSDTAGCVKVLEMEEDLKRFGVEVGQLDKPKKYKLPGWDGPAISVSSVAVEADKIINVPKFKAHQQLGATFAVKNMFGAVPGKKKAYWHFAKGGDYHAFCTMLIGIYRLLGPVISIIDGVVAMEGAGPINGDAKPLGVIVGGVDPVACEMICCELVKFDPEELPIITTAKQVGFGCCDRDMIEVVGDDYTKFVCDDFTPAVRIPLRFSLTHVIHSVSKQAYLTVKSAFSKKGS